MTVLTRNFGLKLVAIVIGFSLWLYVLSQSPLMDRGVFSFKLVPRNVPSDVVVVKMPEVASIEAEGTREEIAKLKRQANRLTATIDLSDALPGVGEFRVQRIDPQDVNVKWGRAESVIVSLDKRVSVQRPVEVEAYKSPDGLEFTGATVQPESVTLEGPEQQINQVKTVRAQIDLGGNGFRPGTSFQANVEVLGDTSLLPLVTVSPVQVLVRPLLSPSTSRKVVLIAPSIKGQPAPGFRITGITATPNVATLRGDTRLLQPIQTVETSEIDLGELRDTRTFTVTLRASGSIRVEPRTVRVQVRVEPLPSTPSTRVEPPP